MRRGLQSCIKPAVILLCMVCAVLVVVLLNPATQVTASAIPAPETQKADNSACLSCHSRPGQILTLKPSEETVSSTVDQSFEKSVHAAMKCTDCHKNITGYPHPAVTAKNRREYTNQHQDTCKGCHDKQIKELGDSIHHVNGNLNSPLCSDCHNPHTQMPISNDFKFTAQERIQFAQTCSRCHSTIFKEYEQSVHGDAVLNGANPDVPTCIDCHGVHTIKDPTKASFRLSSVEMCSKCHTNPAIMNKYKISTEVLNSYVSDFHGTTVSLFNKQNPDELTNKAVCYDCHGVHNILKVDDPKKGLHVKQNLLNTCKKCHPDASLNFPDSWMSHYIADPERTPWVYYVQLFYNILIPLVIGAMLVFVIVDFIRRQIDRRKHHAAATATEK